MPDNNGGTGQEGAGQQTPEEKKASESAELLKKVDELVASNKKLNADLELEREERQRTQEMLKSLSEGSSHNGDGTARKVSGRGRFADPNYRSEFERKYSLPAEAADEIIEETAQRLGQEQFEREQALRQGEALKKSFFDAYPDLAEDELVVRHFADVVTREHPNWTTDKGFVEVAKRSREYIKSKLGGSASRNEPPDVLPGASRRGEGSRSGSKGEEDEVPRLPTQDEEITSEMDMRRKMRGSAL